GTLWQQAGKGKLKKQHIAVDGSVYEKMPLAKDNIHLALSELLGEEAAQVDTILDNGGSGLGAAIAAAMSQK
ncbi:MAG: hexokinase, partial [Selenomonadaceae bacterium]|nr:hexokinase [Selenomonadaceae bacterium]